MTKWLKLTGATLAALLVVASAGFYVWTRIARYPAFPEAASQAEQAKSERGWYVFEPTGEPRAGFIFYPGGLIDPAAYAPLMQRLSDAGVRAVIVPMPLDLAVFGIGRADAVISEYPDVDTWIIGGHSLGGAMAAEYLKRKPGAVDAVVFLASYPADSTDLSSMPLSALSIYGTEDGVAGDVFEDSLQRIPKGAELKVIAGGNHAQFGDYGPQKGDGKATVGRGEQQRMTADAILELVEMLTEVPEPAEWPPDDDPDLPREDADGNTPGDVVLSLADACNGSDWRTQYALYTNQAADYETARREWEAAAQRYSEFNVLETRISSATAAAVRVAYTGSISNPDGSRHDFEVAAPGEWWPLWKVGGVWKVQWLPRQ